MKQTLYNYYVIDRTHHGLRKKSKLELGKEYAALGLTPEERMVRRFELLSSLEVPHIHPEEQIVLMRTVENLPDVLTEVEWTEIKKDHYIHELGYVSNLSPDYEKTIKVGLLARREESNELQKRMINAIIALCDRYKAEAEKMGREDVVKVLTRVPRYGARNLREALQFFRILHYSLWLEGDYHNTVGRFDQYMYPYFKQDMDAGLYTRETALELIEDFFLSFNKDSDLYVGVQQGDNGQSMVLGGYDRDGNDCFNLLSELCLEASRNLKLIDPKINLRVSKKTPLSIYEKGTELTKVGLGFPQYSNDDVVIEGLTRLGYDYEDAVNYVVAACWEFIIPGVGNDIANIGAVNFPAVVDRVIRAYLPTGGDFEGLIKAVKDEIQIECDKITDGIENIWFVPSPFMDLLRDGRKYHNFGLHGSGIACAADALASVEKYIYNEKRITPERLLQALDTNYENDPELLHLLRYESPKMGTGNKAADDLGGVLLHSFADALEGKQNCMGGVWRAGTGTAMYYLWHTNELGATADGRRAGEPFGTNFSPSLFAQIPGPLTDIESFTANDLSRNMNGGPLTLEFAAGIFNSPESIQKVAALIKYFVERGGHQLQLNAVNLDAMKEAQQNPEAYRQLVVRIWGWSAYFVELDKDFQDHVMARQEYSV
ncbi:MAG: pyruvate formate-lyase [Clostridia bacterium]|nr:pyruvate formate-lyase [Clostridia bacterium]